MELRTIDRLVISNTANKIPAMAAARGVFNRALVRVAVEPLVTVLSLSIATYLLFGVRSIRRRSSELLYPVCANHWR